MSAPPLVITDTDKRGAVVVVSVVTLSFLIVAFLTRIYVRLKVSGPWSHDDTTLSVATAIGVGQSIAVFVEVKKGFGQVGSDLDAAAIASIGQADYASSVLYLLALCMSKCSVIALIVRLTAVRKHRIASWINVGAAVVWFLSSLLIITIKCNPAGPLADLNGQCPGLFSRWIYVCALDIATELAIFSLSLYLVSGLKMSMKLKATVVLAFALRLPIIAMAATRLYYLDIEIDSTDPTLAGYNAVIWTQAQVSYSLFATAAACLGPFLRPFTRPYLADTRYAGHSSGRGKTIPAGYDLSNLSGDKNSGSSKSGGGHRKQASGLSEYASDRLRPDLVSHESHISGSHHASGQRPSLDSHDSKRMIITKNMDWTVEYDGEGETSTRRQTSSDGRSD